MKRSASNAAIDSAPEPKRTANSQLDSPSPAPPPVLWLDDMLARQLPHVERVDNTQPCSIRDVASRPFRHDLTLKLLNSASKHAQTQIYVDVKPRHLSFADTAWTLLQLVPRLHVPDSDTGSPTTEAVMSFTQLLRLINVPAELVPLGIRERVWFSDVQAEVTIHTAAGVALYIRGSAQCGPCRGDRLSFFNRLSSSRMLPTSPLSSELTLSIRRLLQSPLNLWLTLACRPVLNAAIFPAFAASTRHDNLEPEYVYVLCRTEGGVVLSDERRKERIPSAVTR